MSVDDPAETYTAVYTPDDLNRLKTATFGVAGQNLSYAYDYDSLGNLDVEGRRDSGLRPLVQPGLRRRRDVVAARCDAPNREPSGRREPVLRRSRPRHT